MDYPLHLCQRDTQRLDAVGKALGLVLGGGANLGHPQFARSIVKQNDIGEGPTDINTDSHRITRYNHARPLELQERKLPLWLDLDPGGVPTLNAGYTLGSLHVQST